MRRAPSKAKTARKPTSFLDTLGNPAKRALTGAGLSTLKQLSKVHEGVLLGLHGVGPSAIKRIQQALTDAGLSFAKEKKILSKD